MDLAPCRYIQPANPSLISTIPKKNLAISGYPILGQEIPEKVTAGVPETSSMLIT